MAEKQVIIMLKQTGTKTVAETFKKEKKVRRGFRFFSCLKLP